MPDAEAIPSEAARWRGIAYRAHDPRWAWAPTSGEGAARHGGRFNPAGVPALYLALTIEGMFAEAAHGFAHRFEPLTVCAYDVDVAPVAELRTDAGRASHGVDEAELGCAWAYERACGREPASWRVARRLIAAGWAGILVPSYATGARPEMGNLVLWRWGDVSPARVAVHDPNRRLPRARPSANGASPHTRH